MTMLIRGGVVHTMTDQGTLTGDVLIEDGRIAAIGPDLRLPKDAHPCTLSARGLHVLPGLIDAHIQCTPEPPAMLHRRALAAWVTSMLVWPEGEGPCTLVAGGTANPSDVWQLNPAAYTDRQLADCLQSLAAEGLRPACEIDDPASCERLQALSAQTGVRMLLVHLRGCEALETALAAADCDIVLGVAREHGEAPWGLAARLAAQGKAVALTSNDPVSMMRHLPLCAALSAREGMPPAQALQAITSVPARVLGLTDAGQLAPSFRADLVLYDGDPLQPTTSHVMTIRGGQICH